MKKVLSFLAVLGICSFAYAGEENIGCSKVYKRKDGQEKSYTETKKTTESCAAKQKQNKDQPDSDIGLSFAIKGAYFWPESSVFRDIYGDGNFSPLFEVCYNIYKCLGTWMEAGYFYDSGHVQSVNIYAKTKVTQVPLSAGLSCTYSAASFLDLYVKVGPNWMYTKTWTDIPNLKKTVIKNTFGGTFGVGGKFKFCKHGFVELFLNYLYDKKNIKSADGNFTRKLGGIQSGVGLGYAF